MSDSSPETIYDIKKYPNRRFYDATRRRHVTLNDLYELVRSGSRIVVTDSRTGQDITNVVLTQIILEHDPPKLDLFPPALLHQAIQANQQLVRRFIEEYFANAMNAFVNSSKQFDAFVRQAGLSALPSSPFEWARRFFGGMPGMTSTNARPESQSPPTPDGMPPQAIDELQSQVQALRAELAEMRSSARKSGRKNNPR